MPTATPEKTKAVKSEPKAETRPDARFFLMQNLPREQGDVLKIAALTETCFRCNWYTPDKAKGMSLTTFRLRKSAFIRCQLGADGKVEKYDIPEKQ